VQQHHFGLDLWHLASDFNASDVGPVPPNGDYVVGRLRIVDGDRGNCARTVLKQALQVDAGTPDPIFQPDYCLIYINGENEPGVFQILWISSDSDHLQMRYRSSDGISDECCIKEATPGNVRHMLAQLIWSSVQKAFTRMVSNIYNVPLPFDLMSIDPKQSEDVFGCKRWTVLGKVPIAAEEIKNQLDSIRLAIDFPPAYTARSFTPRLAVSADVPATLLDELVGPLPEPRRVIDGLLPTPLLVVLRAAIWIDEVRNSIPITARQTLARQLPPGLTAHWPREFLALLELRRQFLLLMSFESRLAELYVDGKSQGFCALSFGWTQTKVGPGARARSLGLELASDQPLNEILVKAKKPLKPKTTSSGN
jgi:hypothetical protein